MYFDLAPPEPLGRRLFQAMALGLLSCVLWASALLAAAERFRRT